MKRAAHWGFLVLVGAMAHGCNSSPPPTPVQPALLQPGEYCDSNVTKDSLVLRFDPPTLVVATGDWRPVKLVAAPDLCDPLTATFSGADPNVVQAPSTASLDYANPSFGFTVRGGMTAGKTTLTVTAQRALDSAPATATLAIEVKDPKGTTCDPMPSGTPPTADSGMLALSASATTIQGTGALSAASLSVPPGAFARTDEFGLAPFSADIATTGDLAHDAAGNPSAIGWAVRFTPMDKTWLTHTLRRELDFAIPVFPQCVPSAARMRHLQVLYSGPRATHPRIVTVANPRMEELPSGDWVLRFSSPWFGSYQAAFAPDAGTKHTKRHLTHRAVLGISMGGGGAASFGLRHHDQFDVVGPLGGPSSYTWWLWYIQQFKLGGFCPVSNPNCPKYAPNLYPIDEPIAHTEDYDHWFFQAGAGAGGNFDRTYLVQGSEDLSLMMGNPNGQNADPAIPFMMPGPKASDPFVHGTVSNVDCSVTINPIGPNGFDPPDVAMQVMKTEMQQQLVQQECLLSRCDPKNVWIAPKPYYDANFNPDGTRQVISYCDGNSMGTAPYEDDWLPPAPGHEIPVNMALAVDSNKNGLRDEGEPIIRQGTEPWDDTGVDGVADAMEPFYDPVLNPDPHQDDYDPQINPGGTEGDHYYEKGEPFRDWGVDGVQNTPQQKDGGYDVGEGDGVFTMAPGLTNFYGSDGDALVRQRMPPASAPLDDDALARIGAWSDGGIRDMLNFESSARHFQGAIASRLGADGTPLRSTALYFGFEQLPGQDPKNPDAFSPSTLLWDDIVDAPSLRYGSLDATQAMVANGDGQHVGTASQIVDRLLSAFYFTAHAWPDAPHFQAQAADTDPTDPGFNVETTTQNELGIECEIQGVCDKIFTGPKTQRTGPVAIVLPPGYALAALQARNVRYPVVYVLHGYGQDPRDLQATAAITGEYMAGSLESAATRLASAILVYVDGRCRIDPVTMVPECIRGTFFLNGVRTVSGHPIARLDDWFEEVMQYIDQNYRTMGPSVVDVIE